MVKENEFDLTQILNIFWGRKEYVIAVFVVVFPLSAYLAKTLPNVYRSSTLILITPQKLPSSYVNSTVTMTIQERIYTITQEMLSRTRLEEIVKRFDLYPITGRESPMGERVNKLRKNVQLENPRMGRGQSQNSFRLSFESDNPKKTQQVAAALTSLFIEENLKLREQRAVGTTIFIKAEGDRLQKVVERQEARVNLFRGKYQHELPGQLPANLSRLDQVARELERNFLRLTALEDRKSNIEKQLVDEKKVNQPLVTTEDGGREYLLPQWQRVESLKNRLESLLSRYSNNHPDVIDLKRELQAAEAEEPTQKPESGNAGSTVIPPKRSSASLMLSRQTVDLDAEIKSIHSNNKMLRENMVSYQARVDNTPIRSIELSKISRTYDITLRKYQDLLAKLLESELSENMEKKQKAEQFQVIDPANLPVVPVRPNRLVILLMGFAAGLGGGLALAYLLEMINNSFKSGNELSDYVNIPLLASIPAVATRGTVLHKRREQALLVLMSVAGLAVGLVGIRLYVQYFA